MFEENSRLGGGMHGKECCDPPAAASSVLEACLVAGAIFARTAGSPQDPLILYVHGSGPHNSSLWWNELVLAVCAGGGEQYTTKPFSANVTAYTCCTPLANIRIVDTDAGDIYQSGQGYYHVAIDCPGYGRSSGDRQAIRSCPGR